MWYTRRWSSISEHWAFRQLFHSPSPSSRGSLVLLRFLPLGWRYLHISDYWYFLTISWQLQSQAAILTPAWALSSPAFRMMYSAYKLNKQDDNIQPWRTPFPIRNQLVLPCQVLTVAFWLASQKAGKVRDGISISSRIFRFVVIHTVKGFSVVNEAEVVVFLKLPCFFYDSVMLAIWSLILLPLQYPACTSGSSQFTYCWSLTWRILNIILITWGVSTILQVVWTLFGIALLLNWNEHWPFRSCGHSWVFQICWYIDCSPLTALSFRILNSSPEILSPPLALFVVSVPQAHLTSHSRMSGSKWAPTPSLPQSLRLFSIVLCILATSS